jgi:signal peptide peptidase SppA
MSTVELNIPSLAIPHFDQYVGVWAIKPENADALLSLAGRIDITAHLQERIRRQEQLVSASDPRGNDPAKNYEVNRDGIALIPIQGTMLKHQSSFATGTSTALARRQVQLATRDQAVRGILLMIDSPGGSVAGTELLGEAVARASRQKPTWAAIDDLGASAAYWVASQADRITANKSSAVGSIGVYTVVQDFSASDEKQGRKIHVVKFGANKAIGAGGPVTDEQLAEVQRLIDARGEQFIEAVAAGRKIDASVVRQWADGRVELAPQALALGMIDAVQDDDTTLAELAEHIQTKNRRAVSMSQPNADAPVKTFAELAAERRAEIVAVCPKADTAFIDSAVCKGLTPLQAVQAWNEQLEERAAAADKRAAEAEAAAAANKPKRGTEPLATKTDEEEQPKLSAAELRDEIDAACAKTRAPRGQVAVRVLKKHGYSREYVGRR